MIVKQNTSLKSLSKQVAKNFMVTTSNQPTTDQPTLHELRFDIALR